MKVGALIVAALGVANAWGQGVDTLMEDDSIAQAPPPIVDRIEGFNRAMFSFNDGFYRVIWRPLSRGYSAVVPRPVRRGIGNVFHNIAYPTRLVGDVLEGHGRGALKETGRFLLNSTVGLAGIMTPANDVPSLKVPESDLGQAFAIWGVHHGTYLVLPVFGPTSLRDGLGDAVSGFFLDPVQYLNEWEYVTSAEALRAVNQAPDALKTYDALTNAAIDPYVSFRDAYAARRAQQVREQLADRAGDQVAPGAPAG